MKKILILSNRLKNKEVLLMDGATGTEIQRRRIKTTLPLWSAKALFTHPKIIHDIHLDYIKNGAEIIVTNTFRTTKRTLKKSQLGHEAKKITKLACKLVQHAIKKANANRITYIAGSVAPLEDCYSPHLTPSNQELQKEHLEHAWNLKEGGVDFLLIETMITIKESLAAIQAALQVKKPFAISFCCDKNGNLLGGELLKNAIQVVRQYNPLFIGINCIPPHIVDPSLNILLAYSKIPICVYANGIGKAHNDEGWLFSHEGENEMRYAAYAKEWMKKGIQIIGGCCGTTPAYIAKLYLQFSKN